MSKFFVQDIHYWIGNETSPDEAGSAAVVCVMLDHLMGGGSLQYREDQYSESKLFRSYFRRRLTYLPGGVQSGMNYVAEEQIPRKLYLVKGREDDVISSQASGK